MVYDAVGPVAQFWMRMLGNTLIVVLFSLSFKPTLDYVLFMSFKTSGVLGIPMHLAYSCYIIFLIDIIIRYAMDIVADLRRMAKGGIR
jgi:TRAP-type C4-dicarboxylate transport system permease small subunit